MKENTPTDLLISIAKVLDGLKIDYYVTGGFAVSVWGRPRFTADIDLIVKMSHFEKKEFAAKIHQLFPRGLLDSDQIDSALAQHGEFNFLDPDTGMKIDFWITKNEEFEKNCFENSITKDIGYKVKFISPENLVLSKLIWFGQTQSSRHLEDAQTVLDVTPVSKNLIKSWALKLNLTDEYEKLKFEN